MFKTTALFFLFGMALTLGSTLSHAQKGSASATADRQAAIDRGIAFLAKSQGADGSYSTKSGTGVTSLIVHALLRNGRSVTDPTVAKGLKYLEANVREDGGIYAEKSFLRNYETCLAVVCLAEANKDGKYTKIVKNADKYLKGIQIDEQENKNKSDLDYGGVNYGTRGSPDLSNTSYLVEALVAAGNGPEDEALQKALVFISRCQNLESEHNTTPSAAKVNDGGFYYSVAEAEAKEAKQGKGKQTPEGGLRSYGSMSYAGLKSMLYAGLTPEDQRVKAALKWLGMHYTIEQNPGLGDAGLYYYYQLMAKALDAAKMKTFVDDKGVEHDWKAEMTEVLLKKQKEDGSWVNSDAKWMESDPNLATGFAILALSYCK
jgi:squalene-hopene/tetraprenyl-beta-curcumene cyclase